MREYNLFIIKKEYYEYYRKNPLFLFDALKKLYTLKEDFNYGISLYSQLCDRINPFTLRHFINKKYNLDNNKTFYMLIVRKFFINTSNNIRNHFLNFFFCKNSTF